ncbi:MJ0042 family finger-like domain-containing protein [Poseidonocella pacifica]|uniref:MJ0042 family finger-like domain-containing protein n=1 Tax=Poseidonocella pacifica TaxID=871651 RepID=A0A1I0WNN7_9RHOB|nr:zinc-ribbon domain-containing protein [Poseidonocella pacifica]SFA90395.1 MJ0042 family finger-like domain-containing protein [Poseidonocella pacifica]
MRLTCPNCGAEYEVPEEAIPLSGRDVQCSNCSTQWFQLPAEFEDEEEFDPAPEPQPTATDEMPSPPRDLDPAVAAILREEVVFEERRRAEEAQAAELARAKAEAEAAVASPAPPRAQERSELPDVAEIASSFHEEPAAEQTPKRPSGFRRGFLVTLSLAAIALVIYAFAAEIGTTIPELQGPLESYVQTINEWRNALDTLLVRVLRGAGL